MQLVPTIILVSHRIRGEADLAKFMWDWLVCEYAFAGVLSTTSTGHRDGYFTLVGILGVAGLVMRLLITEVFSRHGRVNTATECWIITSNVRVQFIKVAMISAINGCCPPKSTVVFAYIAR